MSLDQLLLEASAEGYVIQSLCESYLRFQYPHFHHPDDPIWVCWLRHSHRLDYTCVGTGQTAAEALASALDSGEAFSPIPEVHTAQDTYLYRDGLTSLDSLIPTPQPQVAIIPGAVRRL